MMNKNILFLFFTACKVTRTEMGLPLDWSRVEGWLHNKNIPMADKEILVPIVKLKNPEIPILQCYESIPAKSFWEKFPSNELPSKASTKVSHLALWRKVVREKPRMTCSQFTRAEKTVGFLKYGADCCQKTPLPSCMQKNAKNAYVYGAAVTDTVASWVKDGFAAGPFDTPPVGNFRVNCLMAIPQSTKVRPVLNGSLPEGRSLNSNVDPVRVEKVKMCSSRCFSYSVVHAGEGGIMAKMDMMNAYKNVPCIPSEFRLQGFHWLGKYFIETRQIFGAKTAVCNFDVLGKTVLDLTLLNCEIDRSLVHRQLDDVPVVVPSHKKEWCKEFVSKYKENCNDFGIGLAMDDPNMDKAFSWTKVGKVLGIIFRTTDLHWSYPEDKKMKVLSAIEKFFDGTPVDLLQMQKLMGRLNDVNLMCPFLKNFKGPLNDMLGWLQRNPEMKCVPSDLVKNDLLVWSGFMLDKNEWKPISHMPCEVPISHFSFASDAAGMDMKRNVSEDVGVGCIGFDINGEVILTHQLFWPKSLAEKKDEKGASFGSKTIFLESIGLLIPFLLIPDKIKCAHVVLNVDNMGCYFGWENRNVKGDKCATIVFRTIALISAFLEINVHVRHMPRVSCWEACICDRLSRKITTTLNDKRLLRGYENLKIPKELLNWLEDPTENWNICIDLLNYVKKKIH